MTRVFVLDTSYLVELYAVPGFSESGFREEVKARMARARDARFVVPVGCLYKLCDHIADVSDGRQRRRLATKIATDVDTSVRRRRPWLIVPANGLPDVAKAVRAFAGNPNLLQLGLTNSQTANVARAWKKKYAAQPNYAVHIWTRNQRLKALEPDAEPDPLM